MYVNNVDYDETETDTVLNHSVRLANKTLTLFNVRHQAGFKSSIEWFKHTFGRQKTTVTYSSRNWVWTFEANNNDAVIYCLVSKRGISWEYDVAKTWNPKSLERLLDEIIEKLSA